MNKLISFKDKSLVKVITGLRRSGKSSLMKLFSNYLLSTGVENENIIYINFESIQFDEIKDYKDLYNQIKSLKPSKGKIYILLDEIQQVKFWEKAVNSFIVDFDCDIYLTGSNAYLLSSELSTLLSGRFVEIKLFPLSFKEFLDFNNYKEYENKLDYFHKYMDYGALPNITELNYNLELISPFLAGIYNTVIMKDVIQRNNVRDVALLENIIRFLADNIGSPVSTKKISDYLTSAGRKTTPDTVDNYITMLENAFIIYKANRYDIKGKLYLKTNEKYYISDTGLRNEILGFRNRDYGHVLENMIYIELLRRGYKVYIGKMALLEIDFVAEKIDSKVYYQVSATLLDENTRQRELKPLQLIGDNYEKIILTMDDNSIRDYEGIKVKNIIEFLLEEY